MTRCLHLLRVLQALLPWFSTCDKNQMHPTQSLLPSVLVLLTLSSASASFSGSYYLYVNCTPHPYTCGATKVNITYPFRVDGRPDYCGHPRYYIACSKDNTSMMVDINGKGYQVKAVDYLNHLITVVDQRIVEQRCPRPYQNTSVDFSLYNYSDRDRNVTLFINCSFLSPISDLYHFDCASNITGRHWYYQVNNENPVDLLGKCDSKVLVPIHQTIADELANRNLGFGDAVKEGFSLVWTAGKGWCCDCVNSGGRCGYDRLSPANHTCYCPYASAIGTCSKDAVAAGIESKKDQKRIKGTVIALVSAGLALLCLFLLVYILRCRKSRENNNVRVEVFLQQHGSLAPKRYRYSEIKRMTKSFSNKLGQGGYGSVFKGTLPDGRSVAIKLLSESEGNGEEFINEVASISRTSHVNIVSLLGFCSERSKRALVYEFMPNGSLEKFIYSDKSRTEAQFGCEKIYEIALGTARGLEYLHGGCNTRIVHFDIKPHNILLDQDFCPKISDFGLAKLCPPKVSVISMVAARGTVGYIAPEVFSRSFGVVSSKSDVYSYGMMLLEMVGGRRNIDATNENTSEVYFPHWLYDNLDRYCNLGISGVTSETQEIARKMIIIGLWCIQTTPEHRPTMTKVVEMLKGSVEDLQMPPRP